MQKRPNLLYIFFGSNRNASVYRLYCISSISLDFNMQTGISIWVSHIAILIHYHHFPFVNSWWQRKR